jgi:hypothetical protein
MTRPFRRATSTILLAAALLALCGPGCGPRNDAAPASPDKLVEAQKARGASLQGEAGGLVKTARRR